MIPQGFTWAAGTMTGAGSDITAATHVEELLNMFAIVACFFIGSWLIVKLMSMVDELEKINFASNEKARKVRRLRWIFDQFS